MSDHQLVKTPVVKKAKVKKTPFFTKDLVKCVIVLASIALVASLLLGVMNWLTYVDPDETIMKEVAGYFGTDLSAVSKDESMAGENVNACFVAKDGDTVLGYCFYAVGTGAKDGTMELLVYINSDGVMSCFKDVGLVTDVFTKDVLEKLKSLAILKGKPQDISTKSKRQTNQSISALTWTTWMGSPSSAQRTLLQAQVKSMQ